MEAGGLGCVLEVVGPSDVVFIEEIEDGSVDGLVAAWGWGDVAGGEMAEGGGGHKVRAVGEGGSEDGGEVAVVDGELLGEIVVEGDFALGVEVHGLIFSGVFYSGRIDLFGHVVDADEAVGEEVLERVVGVIEVGFAMGGEPAVVEIGADAAARVMKDGDDLAGFIFVAVGADEVAADVEVAGESVDASVVVFGAARGVVAATLVTVMLGLVIGTTRSECEGSEVVIEGVVLLHDDDDVLDLAQVAVGAGRARKDQGKERYCCQECGAGIRLNVMRGHVVSRGSADQIFRLNSPGDHTGTMLRRDEHKVKSYARSGMPTLAASFAMRWAFALRRRLLQKDAA